MHKTLLIIILSFIALGICAQKPLNYEHRSIFKKMRKHGCPRKAELIELSIPKTVFKHDEVNGKYFFVKDNACVSSTYFVFVGRVNTCRSSGCQVHYGGSDQIHFEYFDYFILFDQDARVLDTKVMKYESTHGHEITAGRWLKQFRDYEGSEDLKVGKDIDGITGATTSVYAITYDIQERTKRLKAAKDYYEKMLSHFFFLSI